MASTKRTKKSEGSLRIHVSKKDVKQEPKQSLSSDEREYFRALHKIVDAVYNEAAEKFDWTWSELAEHADVCYVTVQRLGERETKYPRFHTIHKLAKAVGWTLETTADHKKVKVKKAG